MQAIFSVERSAGGRARRGRLITAHGEIETPTLVPLASAAAVQSLTPDDLRALRIAAVAIDGFELACRPGVERIAALGGLRAMMGWSGPLLALSGGHRLLGGSVPDEAAILAYAGRIGAVAGPHGRRVRGGRPGSAGNAGLRLASPVDGAPRLLTPEDVVTTAEALDADLAVTLDQPIDIGRPDSSGRTIARARERAVSWARQGANARRGDTAIIAAAADDSGDVAPAGAVGLTRRAEDLRSAPTDWRGLQAGALRLVVGGVDPTEIVGAATGGADLIVTAAPTALADLGVLYAKSGPLDARDPASERDERPIELGCACPTCRQHSRSYVRHLFVADELLGYRLAALHNLHHLESHLARLRSDLR